MLPEADKLLFLHNFYKNTVFSGLTEKFKKVDCARLLLCGQKYEMVGSNTLSQLSQYTHKIFTKRCQPTHERHKVSTTRYITLEKN